MLYIASAQGNNTGGGVSILDAATTLDIQAGDVLAIYCAGNIGTGSTFSAAEDNASNAFTSLGGTTQAETLFSAYLLSAAASTGAIIRGTLSANSNGDFGIIVFQFRPEAGEIISLAGGGAFADSAWGSNPTSANLSAGEANSVFVGGAVNDRTALLTNLIGGISPDLTLSATNDFDASYKIFSTTQTAINYATTSGDGIWGAGLLGFNITTGSIGATVDDINTDENVDDAEANITFTTSNFSGEITTAKLVSGIAETSVSGLTSTSGSGDFDLPDISGFTSDTVGCPLTSASNAVVCELSDGTDTDDLAITYNAKTGWEVVEITGAVKTTGSIFENFVGTINNTSQIYYSTADTTAVSATGIVTTDSTVDIVMQFWDQSDNTWKQLTLLIDSANIIPDEISSSEIFDDPTVSTEVVQNPSTVFAHGAQIIRFYTDILTDFPSSGIQVPDTITIGIDNQSTGNVVLEYTMDNALSITNGSAVWINAITVSAGINNFTITEYGPTGIRLTALSSGAKVWVKG